MRISSLQLFSVPLIYVLVEKEARYKLSWVLIIFLLPGAGFLLYFLWGSKREFSWFNRRFARPSGRWASSCHPRGNGGARRRGLSNEAPLGGYMARSGYPCTNARTAVFFPAVRTSTQHDGGPAQRRALYPH